VRAPQEGPFPEPDASYILRDANPVKGGHVGCLVMRLPELCAPGERVFRRSMMWDSLSRNAGGMMPGFNGALRSRYPCRHSCLPDRPSSRAPCHFR
jgi:hypothetical protein